MAQEEERHALSDGLALGHLCNQGEVRAHRQEERRRDMQERQQSMMDALNAQREGLDWRALVLPALGLAWVTFFLGVPFPHCCS